MEVEILRALDVQLVRELSLVLNSVGIQHRVVGNQHQQWILTSEENARAALEELANYQRENTSARRREPRLLPKPGGWTQALLWFAVLSLTHVLAQAGSFGVSWKAAGAVDGVKVFAGELWRPITALTLHADFEHLAGNLAFGALFVVLLHQVLGAPLTWALVVAGGATGNLMNVAFRGEELRSLGASTAVFAALGSLTAVQWSRKAATPGAKAKRWIPLIMGVLLLGWNGMGRTHHDPWLGIQRPVDDNTDVGAHIAGFLCGLALGALAWRLRGKGKITPRVEQVLAVAVPFLVVLAWGLAIQLG